MFDITTVPRPLLGARMFSIYLNVAAWKVEALPQVLDNWSGLLGNEGGRLDGQHAVMEGRMPSPDTITFLAERREMYRIATERGMVKRI
ncbi:MAG: hypothetical protein MJA83_06290, partial [Gammaproteobacteria bacterium]|nr:hypothetical protein [Gammaproteobacteria bacterium]